MSTQKQKSCIPCHFLIANNKKLHTFSFYFSICAKWSLLSCDSILGSSLSWRMQLFLFLLPSQQKVQPKGFSIWMNSNNMIQLHYIHTFFLLSYLHQLWNTCIPTSPPPMCKTWILTTKKQNMYLFGTFISMSQSPFVSCKYFHRSKFFIFKKKKKLNFILLILLFCNQPDLSPKPESRYATQN